MKQASADFTLILFCICVVSLQLEEVLRLRRMAASLTTCWLTSEKVSSLERLGPGAKRKVPLLVKCIGTPVRTRQLGPLRNGFSPNAWNHFPFSSPLLHDRCWWMAAIVPAYSVCFLFISMTKGDKEWKGIQALGHGVLALGDTCNLLPNLQLLLHLPAFHWWLPAHTAAFVMPAFKCRAHIYQSFSY